MCRVVIGTSHFGVNNIGRKLQIQLGVGGSRSTISRSSCSQHPRFVARAEEKAKSSKLLPTTCLPHWSACSRRTITALTVQVQLCEYRQYKNNVRKWAESQTFLRKNESFTVLDLCARKGTEITAALAAAGEAPRRRGRKGGPGGSTKAPGKKARSKMSVKKTGRLAAAAAKSKVAMKLCTKKAGGSEKSFRGAKKVTKS